MPPADVVAAALALLVDVDVDDVRPLCPSCAKAPQAAGGLCVDCTAGTPSIERHRAAKRAWWAEHGSAARRDRRIEARAA